MKLLIVQDVDLKNIKKIWFGIIGKAYCQECTNRRWEIQLNGIHKKEK